MSTRVISLAAWVVVILGIAIRDPWVFAPGALVVLVTTIEADR